MSLPAPSVMTEGERRSILDRLLGRPTRAYATPSISPSAPNGPAAQAPRPPPRATAASAHPAASTPRRRHTWASLLQRVRDVTKATAVVAIDDQGLVIGHDGDLTMDDVEDVAAHLALAFDLFERLSMLGTKPESVCAQYIPEGTWLTAVRLRPVDAPPLTVGIIGPHTLVREDRRRVRDAFMLLLDPPTDPSATPPPPATA